MEVTIVSMAKRWTDALTRPLFKGCLIDKGGCVCAQGDVLRCAGYTDEQLRSLTQNFADKAVAKILGISSSHSVLLRNVNDSKDGCPQDVLMNPARVLGSRAADVLKFWLFLDTLTLEQWAAAEAAARAAAWAAAWAAAGAAAGAAAEAAAGAAAGDAAWAAAGTAAGAAAWAAAGAAAEATNEIQGLDVLRQQKKELYFVKFFNYNLEGIQ